MVKVNEIKAQMRRQGITQAKLAGILKLNPSTLNRKINNIDGENLTVKEATKIITALQIPNDLIESIFFSPELAETQDMH